jgi:PIN domain nuclease of toxin-antitoxin system
MASVLDSSAVLALLKQEPGWEQVLAGLQQSVISSVNQAEVLRVLVRGGASPTDARRALVRLHLPIIAFDSADAVEAAEVAQIAPELSLGDCACLALARARSADQVLTADRAWGHADFGVRVILIR